VESENTVDCILNPGEISLHHVKLVHGSEPNRSNDRRIGLAIRYIPTGLKQLKVRDSATLVSGVDRYVGDSLGMTNYGHLNTLPVTVDMMI
jgi:non-haem Fe2+, alpha-ketoglutarate-dependent halogenase